MERGKELEVKKEKLDQKVALSLSDASQTSSSSKMPSSSKIPPDMDSKQPSKMLSE